MNIIFYLILFELANSNIVLPFTINTQIKQSSNIENYKIDDFLNDYIIRDFYTTIDIGTPSQKLFAVITHDGHLLALSSDEYVPKNFDENKNYNLISDKDYNPSLSSSFNKIKNIKIFSKKNKTHSIITESLLLSDTSILNGNENKIKIDDIKFVFEEDKEEKKHAIIGLNYDTSNKEIPFIVNELKRLNIITNYNWSFKFISKTEGLFIIGSLPHNYENNKKIFNSITYTQALSSSAGDYSYPWSFHFNKIYFNNENSQIIISQITKCNLVPNLGFVIVNSKYKKLILDHYFNDLIENNICQLEKTEITKYNKSEVFFGTNGIYEFFTCNKNKFVNEKNNYKKQFKSLKFDLPKYNYTFELNGEDLFMEINDKYYFLVAFPENKDEILYIPCFLGLPFYQKFRLVFNFDSKTIGFYNNYLDIDIEEEDDINKNQNNTDTNSNKSNTNNYLRIIIEIFVCLVLIIIAFFIGKKINEQRKKRANELSDNNYEYICENNKNENNKESDVNNEKGENNNRIVDNDF